MSRLPYDVRNFDNIDREKLAWRVKNSKDFKLPRLRYWNYDPCRQHRNGWDDEVYNSKTDTIETVKRRGPKPTCTKCGVDFMQHQRLAVAWMYLKKKGLNASSVGTGKQQPVSEPVLTPTGWKPIGDISVGDYVIGRNGLPTEVLGVFPQTDDTVYRVTFNDGSSTRCGPEHLWHLYSQGSSKPFVVTTAQLLDLEGKYQRGSSYYKGNDGRLKFYIPLIEPAEFQSKALEIDPYLMGVWLGDGSVNGLSLNGDDADDILEELKNRGIEFARRHDKAKGTNCTSIVFMAHTVFPKELADKRSWEKYVPEEYLLSSPEDRLSLLRGLLDTDGVAMKDGGVEYSTTSPALLDAVVFLVQSLGGSARVGKARKTKYTYVGELREGRTSYRVNVKLPTEVDPFLVKRKLDSWVRPSKYPVRRYIKSITLEKPERSVCISVAAEDSLYVTKDFIVTHNTYSALGLVAMLYETGEIPEKGKAVIVPRSPALHQWYAQIERVLPSVHNRTLLLDGKYSASKRKQLYLTDWDVLLIGPEMFRNDKELIAKLGPPRNPSSLSLLITDDVDSLRNPDTNTSLDLDRFGRKADRYFIMSASPLQKRLPELHAVLDAVGGESALGDRESFIKSHVSYATTQEKDQYGKEQTVTKLTGYKGLDQVKKKISPLVMRTTAADITDARMPSIVTSDVFLDLYPAQRRRYKELQNEVVTLTKEDGTEQTKRIMAIAKLHYGASICAGLATLGDEDAPRTSVKFDWVMENISESGALGEEKIVIFARLTRSIEALQNRMNNSGIKHVTVWGRETSKEARAEAQQQFWDDPETRVLIGTQAIEQSLNLQVARHLINVDMILNPERMTQLAGRIRRFGSEHSRVFVHNLLTNDTQEERYLPLMEREAAVASYIWEEKSALFKELSSLEMMRLITG